MECTGKRMENRPVNRSDWLYVDNWEAQCAPYKNLSTYSFGCHRKRWGPFLFLSFPIIFTFSPYKGHGMETILFYDDINRWLLVTSDLRVAIGNLQYSKTQSIHKVRFHQLGTSWWILAQIFLEKLVKQLHKCHWPKC